MEVIRIIKVHIPLEGIDANNILEGFRDIVYRYGREVRMEEIKQMIEERFGVE